MHRPNRLYCALVGLLVLSLPSAARGEFVQIESFDNLLLGPVDDQNGWVAENTTSAVVIDPLNALNQALAIVTESTHLYRGVLIPNGTSRMLFMRFCFADQVNLSFGMSDIAFPDRFDHFEVELSLDNAPAELRINDAGTFDFLTQLYPNKWYSCWIWIDGTADVSRIWLHARGRDSADPEDQLESDGQIQFQFRNTTAGNLVNFYIKTGGGTGLASPFYIDDIYLEDTDAANLNSPMEAPAALDGPERAFAGLSAGPNPFRGQTTLRFELPEGALDEPGAPLELTVFDAAGRPVRRITSAGPLGRGIHAVAWEGRDDAGRALSPGVYLIRAAAGEAVATTRAVIVR